MTFQISDATKDMPAATAYLRWIAGQNGARLVAQDMAQTILAWIDDANGVMEQARQRLIADGELEKAAQIFYTLLKAPAVAKAVDGVLSDTERGLFWQASEILEAEHGTPKLPAQEGFFDAVRADSDMTDGQKAYWLAMEPQP